MTKTKNITIIAMLSAISYVVMFISKALPPLMPAAPYLDYDPKNVVIAISGFIFGPLSAFIISAIAALLEMLTISNTGPIGFFMNLLACTAFSCTASFIYKKLHSAKGAIIGLLAGTAMLTIVMVLWNYILTPLYLGVPRQEIAKSILPIFIPFNLFQGALNTAITLLLYKPIVTALRRSGLIEYNTNNNKSKLNIGVILVILAILISCSIFLIIINK